MPIKINDTDGVTIPACALNGRVEAEDRKRRLRPLSGADDQCA